MSSKDDVPSGDFTDDSYVSGSGGKNEPIKVVSDEEKIEDPINEETADSDEQLARDDTEAIDKSNVIKERTRGAAPAKGAYREPGDDEGLPGPEDGRSSTRG